MRLHPQNPDTSRGEVIAVFGQARLFKKQNGKYELVGGSAADHAEAAEWISQFLREAKVEGLQDFNLY